MAEQDAEIAELKRRLAASSRNSSQPPSADGLGKPAPKSLRGRSGRRPGGQPGRDGRTLRQVAVPDEVVVHEPGGCTGCGSALRVDRPPVRTVRRQVFDIPTITVRVVEHRLIVRRCACGALTAAAGPAAVSAPVQYGPHAAAIAVYLCLGQHLPVERTAGLLAELFGTPMSVGTVAAWTTRAAAGRAGVSARVQYGPHAAAIGVYLCRGQPLRVERTAGLLAELFGTPMSVGTVAAWTTRAAAGLEPFTAAARAALTEAPLVHA